MSECPECNRLLAELQQAHHDLLYKVPQSTIELLAAQQKFFQASLKFHEHAGGASCTVKFVNK